MGDILPCGVESGARRKSTTMRQLSACFTFRLLLVGLFFATPGIAQNPPAPLRVAIVGLEHGHVEGFLGQLPQHHDVELVGIADEHSELIAKYAKKYSLPETLFFKSMRSEERRVGKEC